MLLFVLLFFGFCFGMDLNALDTKRQAFNVWKEKTKPCDLEDIIFFSEDENLDATFKTEAERSKQQHIFRD